MARGLKSVEADISQAAIAQSGSPLAQIAGLLFQKQLRKNPMLGMALSQLGGLGGAREKSHDQPMLDFNQFKG